MRRLELKTFFALLVAAGIAVAAGCTSQPQRSGPAAALEQRARAAEESGDMRTAADLYRRLADDASGPERAGYLLEAARIAIAQGNTATAAAWLREADSTATGRQRQRAVVLLADIDLREGRAAEALARLDRLEPPVDIPLAIERDSVRGRALFTLGRTPEAVRTLVERETWLNSSEAILANQQMIWDGLAGSPESASVRTGDPIVDGWLALAPLAAARVEGNALLAGLQDWRTEHANHPAATGLLAALLGIEAGPAAYPRQVALLLPLTSPQRAAATAIRDGFIAAHLAARGDFDDLPLTAGTTIRIYDTGQLSATEAYRRAQLEGADFIVGPLLRPEVDEIVPVAGTVPTLALNFAQSDTSLVGNFFQFALWPEDEASAVARQAIAAGARTAVALVPSNEWGYRLLNGFRTEFEAQGGAFLGFNGYEATAQDFSAPIEALLNLDRSERREERLAANLGMRLAFEPRRRQDVDMIFIGADRRVGRLLAPALRFNFAGDIPTYATSEIYEPGNTGRDNDLNNIYFPDAPWLLSPDARSADLKRTLENFWPRQAGSTNIRLYGMGVDAYALVGALFGRSARWPLEGVSGSLELDTAGRVHRVLPFAQFRNGRPVLLEPELQLQPPGIDTGEVEELAGSR